VPTLGADAGGAVRGIFVYSASARIDTVLTAMLTAVLTAVLTTEHGADDAYRTDGTNDDF
jgi:hypothetical protein